MLLSFITEIPAAGAESCSTPAKAVGDMTPDLPQATSGSVSNNQWLPPHSWDLCDISAHFPEKNNISLESNSFL